MGAGDIGRGWEWRLNYRHAYHAGNFADCVKHAVLVWLLRALQRKPAPVYVLDTHAGAGRYDLEAEAARRTGEALRGIRRLLAADDGPMSTTSGPSDPRAPSHQAAVMETAAPSVLQDLMSLIRACNPDSDAIRFYPGSPWLIRRLLRPNDHLACCELHPDDHAALRRLFARDAQVSVHHRDAWEALGALPPPRWKRALILIDPPFEAPDEFARLLAGIRTGLARFPGGVFAAWYPIKSRAQARVLHDGIRAAGIRDAVAAEVLLREPLDAGRLNGCGMLVVNPPYRFESEVMEPLRAILALTGEGEPGATVRLERVTDE